MLKIAQSALLGGVILLLAGVSRADSEVSVEDVLGPWLTEKKGAVIDIYRCYDEGEPELCGRIAWLRDPYTDEGELKRDSANPKPALRHRPLCGIQVVTNLQRIDHNTWAYGHVYNPQNGEHYSAYLDVNQNGTLHIRVYFGIPLFGKSETWTRPHGIDIGCPEAGTNHPVSWSG